MFCRCRHLRAFHLESLPSVVSTLAPTRYTLKAAFTSQPPSRTFSDSPSSRGSEKVQDGHDGNALNLSDLVGSTRSPLAFKPLPSATSGSLFPDKELEPKAISSEELSLLETQFSDEPLDPAPPKDPSPDHLPWTDYVKLLKGDKLRRQASKAKPFIDPVYAIEQWNHMRTWDRVQLANLSVLRWALLARAGCQLSEPSILYNLSAELVDAYANSPRAQASMVARVLRLLVSTDMGALAAHPMFDPLLQPWGHKPPGATEDETTLYKNLDFLSMDLFSEYYQDKPTLVAKLPRNMILHLTAIAACRCPRTLYQGGLLNVFFAAARRGGPKLVLASPLRDPTPLEDAPTGHVWALFRLVQAHANSGFRREAFRLFQRLVQEKMITPSAISQININQQDPRTVILFAMTRSCLDYEWNTGALELMVPAAQHSPEIFDEQMKTLVNETLHALLKQAALVSPAQKYNVRMSTAAQRMSARQAPAGPRFLLRRIMDLITALRRNHQAFEIEDTIVQQFYIVARLLDFPRIAEDLFSIGRILTPLSAPAPMLVPPSFEVSNHPSGGRVHSAKPRRITSKRTPGLIPPSDEPQPAIMKTSYPAPHGPCLLWLLEAMLKESKNVHLGRRLAREVLELHIDIPVYDRGHFIRLIANAGFAHIGRDLWERYSQNDIQGVIGHAGAMTRLVSLFYHLGRELEVKEAVVDEDMEILSSPPVSLPDRVFPGGGAGMTVTEEEDARALFDADAARGFAREVVDRFRTCKSPLEFASQHDLNALARAYIMMDRTEEGFALFQIIKGRRSPDLHDVNVALLGVAGYNIELASRMIDRMHERGLAPDGVTWGTVIHLAFLKGEMGLMISLVKRAQERGISEFTARTIGSLIRASVSDLPPGSQLASHTITLGEKLGVGPLRLTFGGEVDAEQVRRNLDVAWHLIWTLDPRKFVGVWSLAKFCLDRAMWVGDAELAFRFWKRYLSSKTQWGYPVQAEPRRQLQKLVTTAMKEGQLGKQQAARMLHSLWKGLEPRSQW